MHSISRSGEIALLACALWLTGLADALSQETVLIKEVVSREISVHVGGLQSSEYNEVREVISSEVSFFVENGPEESRAETISREVSLLVTSDAVPPAITSINVTVSPTGETVTLDWGSYNQWEVGDVAYFKIYVTSTGPFTNVDDLAGDPNLRIIEVPGGSTSYVITGLAAYTDHYFAVVPVDGQPSNNYTPFVNYAASYVLSPEIISREMALYVGGDANPPYKETLSREVSLSIVSPRAPTAITSFDLSVSPNGDTVVLNWSNYDQWAEKDIDHFKVYVTATGPFSNVNDLTDPNLRVFSIPGGATSFEISGLLPLADHYFAVVPVDGLGNYTPQVNYGASYVLAPETISREIALFVGGEPTPPYHEAISREISILVPDANVPAPVTGIDSGFSVITSSDAFGAVEMDWSSYDEVAQFDVVRYRIYVSNAFFNNVAGMTPLAFVNAGRQTHTLTGLSGGQILHFAVVAEDGLGNFDPAVRSFSAQASVDGVGEVGNLSVNSGPDSLTFTWNEPLAGSGFLEKYRIYFAGGTAPVGIDKSVTSWVASGLQGAHGYPLRITTLDTAGRESSGRTITGATWMPNPSQLELRPNGASVLLGWEVIQPVSLVRQYAIYRESSPITNVTGLTPIAIRSTNSFLVGDFAQAQGDHFAVATINISGGSNPAVTSISGISDTAGPEIGDVLLSGTLLSPNAVLAQSGLLSAVVTDEWGVASVEFKLISDSSGAETVVGLDQNVIDGFSVILDLNTFADGGYSLQIRAMDVYGNSSSLGLPISVALQPPPPPIITSPVGQFSTQNNLLAVFGTAHPHAPVYMFRDGVEISGPLSVNSSAVFATTLSIDFGEHVYTARSRNRGGDSLDSNPVTVAKRPPLTLTLDSPAITEGGVLTGTVSTSQNVTSNLPVTLANNRPSQLAAASAVVIKAGTNSAPFVINAIQDELIESTYTATLTANALGAIGDSKSLLVADDDWPNLTLTLNTQAVSESAPSGTLIAHLERDPVTSEALTIRLRSSDTSEVAESEIKIPAGVDAVNLPVNLVNDPIVDGAQDVTLQAELVIGSEFLASNPVSLQVTDDEGPILEIRSAYHLVKEGDNLQATVSRRGNANLSNSLEVSISSGDSDRLLAPATVTIPAGSTSRTFIISGIQNGEPDGTTKISLTASATGYDAAIKTFLVSDESLAELVSSGFRHPSKALTDQLFELTYELHNLGAVSPGVSYTQRVYLSEDPSAGNDLLVDQRSVEAGAPVSGAAVPMTINVLAPSQRGDYWLIVETDSGDAIPEIDDENNILISDRPIEVGAAYEVIVSADSATLPANTPVHLSGSATKPDDSPAANVTVAIYVRRDQSERRILALTDAIGNFEVDWQPLSGEGGQYRVAAAHPGDDPATVADQDAFEILTLKTDFPKETVVIDEGSTAVTTAAVRNPGSQTLTGLQITVVDSPAGLSVNPMIVGGISELAPGAAASVQLGFIAPLDFRGSHVIKLEIRTAEGVVIPVEISVLVKPLVPVFQIEPRQLNCSVLRGSQKNGSFKITNSGGAATGSIEVTLPGLDWLTPVSSTPLPSLAPGESLTFDFLLSPATSVPLTLYEGTLLIDSAKGSPKSVPFAFRVVSESKGTLEVEVVDEFFFFSEAKPKVEGAQVFVRDAVTGEDIVSAVTGPSGDLQFPNLTEGWYRVEVTSPNHTTVKGNYYVDAGASNRRQVFLSRELVKYTWTVEEIEIEDRYRVTVETTFETNVPAPVVTVTPAVIELGDLNQIGQQKVVNMTVENHGFIAAQNGEFSFGAHPYYEITPLVESVGSIPAKTSLVVPVTIKRIAGASAPAPPSIAEISEVAMSEESAPCQIEAGFRFSFLCGLIDVQKSFVIGFNGINGDCGPRGLLPNRWNGEGKSVKPRVTRISFATPTLCSCEDLNESVDACIGASSSWNIPGFITRWIGNLERILPPWISLDEDELGASFKIEGELCACCDDDGVGIEGNGSVGLEIKIPIIIGGEADDIVEENLNFGEWEVDDFDIDLFAGLRAELVGELHLDGRFRCDGEGEVCVSGRLGLGGKLGISGSANVDATRNGVEYTGAVEVTLALDGLMEIWARGCCNDLDLDACEFQWGAYANLSATAACTGQLSNGTESLEFGPSVSVTLVDTGTSFDDAPPLSNSESQPVVDSIEGRPALDNAPSLEDSARADGIEIVKFGEFLKPREEVLAHLLPERQEGVCSKVKIRLDQEAVMTRSAFRATLDLENQQPETPLTDVAFELDVRDSNGNPASEHFNVRVTHLAGLGAIDGTADIAAKSTGTVQWTLIPRDTAAPLADTIFTIGGTIRYSLNGTELSIPVSEVPITVRPDASLTLKYFHQRDVLADDPNTELIEASQPYALAVMVENTGAGAANNLRITSGQPEIFENEKGLLIDFQVISSQVEGQPGTSTLTAQFGTLPPNSRKLGTWLLTSSLQGLFTEYNATFEHLDGLGDPKISLIKSVEIHETIRMFNALGAKDDGRPDFLVNDVPDLNDYPDTVHLSDGATEPVAVHVTGNFNGTLSGGDPILTLDISAGAGWTYLRIPDPGSGDWVLDRVVRSDGLEIPLPQSVSVANGGLEGLGNAWLSDRTFIGLGRRPVMENILHLIDKDSTGRYFLHYKPYSVIDDQLPPTSLVEMLPDASGRIFRVGWGGSDNVALAYFDIYVSINGGPWELWLGKTTLRAANFIGDPNTQYAFYSVATDTRGNVEATPGIPDALTTASLTNGPPTIEPIVDQILLEDEDFDFKVEAEDPDGPSENLQYAVESTSPGLVIDQDSGRMTWSPGETDGGRTFNVKVLVTDSTYPTATSEAMFEISVLESNVPPVFSSIRPQTVSAGGLLIVSSRATDSDQPPQIMTFSLGTSPPGMTIDPVSGVISWVPPSEMAYQSVLVEVIANDGAPVNNTASTHFSVNVVPASDQNEITLREWAMSKGIAPDRIFELQDDDRDGVSLKMEYAFGLLPDIPDFRIHNPAVPNGGLPRITMVEGRLRAEYMRRTNDPTLQYLPEFSSDLTAHPPVWESATLIRSVEPVGSDWEKVTVEDTATISTAQRRFGRVRTTIATP